MRQKYDSRFSVTVIKVNMIPYVKTVENELRKRLETTDADSFFKSLNSKKPGIYDFINLISPNAVDFLDKLSEKASINKKMHFGKTIKLYTPLYLSNYCINNCKYCGFNISSQEKRRRLTIEETVNEAKMIKSFGMDSILLVSGEDPEFITVDYLEDAVRVLKEIFSYIAIEIYPLKKNDYKKLFNAGVDGLTLYQETYDKDTYDQFHLSGPKADYHSRLKSIEDGAGAGFRTIGVGVLLGLYDWRIEAFSLAAHGMWLKKHFWKSKLQFSFPRITATNDDFDIPSPVSTLELEQMILAFRILFPESEISVSTRENCEFRNRIALNAASSLSAASSVIPGGYCEEKPDELGQFSLHDTRTAEEMESDLSKMGLEVVYKDWDCAFL